MKEPNKIETKVIPIRENEESEFQAFMKRINEQQIQARKREKKLKIYFTFLIVYIASIMIAGLTGIFIPKIAYITDKYLMICNVIAFILCATSSWTFFKNKMYKEKEGMLLLILLIFGMVMNIVPFILNK